MNKVNRASIEQLLQTEDSASLSIYLPTHRSPTSVHIQEDKIRFKNLIRTGLDSLKEQGIDTGLITQIAANLEEVMVDDTFWLYTTEGLAVFASPASVTCFHLPMECQERVSASDCYDVAILLALASYDTPYYLLAMAIHRPMLYKGDMYGVEQVGIELPESPEVALGIDEMHSNSQTFRAGAAGAKSHGQGDSKQAGSEERLKFMRIIDERIITSKMVDATLPFIIAGTEDDVSSYIEISRIKHIVSQQLHGNHTEAVGVKTHEIHARAWRLIEQECITKKQTTEIDKLGGLLGTGKASIQPEEIKVAAAEGRVDCLLIAMLTHTRDTVTDDKGEAVNKLVLPGNYDTDKLEACSRLVFDQGGKIIAVTSDSLSDHAPQAAIYRY